MPRKVTDENLTGNMHFPAGVELERKLRAIAQQYGISPQVLLRRAAEAIVQCAEEFGSVPLDMRLIQAYHPSRRYESAAPAVSRFEPQLNEAPTSYGATSTREPAPGAAVSHVSTAKGPRK